ncbi:MAG: glycerophosphodiester phosphodiesterase [Myxococcota bacterium]|nr:glycerophosphodiester phosphodiesterase [Myxococcota bacterium]
MKPLVIAHRGASAERPENTLPAYALAVEQRADMIEIDLHRTRDEAIVVVHDEDLRGLGGAGAIEDALLADVKALDAGDGAEVPTLDEVLDGFADRIPFNLEIKCGVRGPYAGLEAAVLAEVRRREILEKTLFSCFDVSVLARLRALEPGARIALLLSPRDAARPLERARSVAAEALNPWEGMVTPELVRAAHAEGLAVYPYTVDDPDRMRRLLEWGVDGIFTNHPAALRTLVDSPGGTRGDAG